MRWYCQVTGRVQSFGRDIDLIHLLQEKVQEIYAKMRYTLPSLCGASVSIVELLNLTVTKTFSCNIY